MFADVSGLTLLGLATLLWLAAWISYYWVLRVGPAEVDSYIAQGWNVVHHPEDGKWHITFQNIWLSSADTQQAGWKYVRRCA